MMWKRTAVLWALASLVLSGAAFASGGEESGSAARPVAGALAPVTLRVMITANPLTDPFTGGDPNKLPYIKVMEQKLGVTLDPIITTARRPTRSCSS